MTCATVREKLAAQDPKNERRQMELMLAKAHVGEHAKAAAIAVNLEETVCADSEFLVDVARTYAQCAAAATGETALQAHYKAEAIRALREAVERG